MKISILFNKLNTKKCCKECGGVNSLTVDHVIPKSLGGANHIGNYQILCKSCNSRKGSKFTGNLGETDKYVSVNTISNFAIHGQTASYFRASIQSAIGKHNQDSLISAKDIDDFLTYLKVYKIEMDRPIKVEYILPKQAKRYVKKFNPTFKIPEIYIRNYYSNFTMETL